MPTMASVLASVSRLKNFSVRAIRKKNGACMPEAIRDFWLARIDRWMEGDVQHGELNGIEAAVSALKLACERGQK